MKEALLTVLYDAEVRIERLVLGAWDTNCYIVSEPLGKETVVIDTPAEADKILQAVGTLSVKTILITHGHSDHLGALHEVKAALRVPIAVRPEDVDRLPIPPDMLLEHGQELSFGRQTLRVIFTPGHTPGSVCFLLGHHLFAGDTIFPDGPGRTNTPQDFQTIVATLVREVFVLADDTVVYPGHGDTTLLGKEKGLFEAFNKRPQKPGTYGDVTWAP